MMASVKMSAVVAGLLLATGAPRLAWAQEAGTLAPAQACAGLTVLQLPGSDMKITKTEATTFVSGGAAPVAYCLAEGVLEPRVGRDGKPYAIGFAIALPQAWNGRFLFQGGGGLNGTVRPPEGGQATGDVPALSRGYAVVSTDSGHTGAVFDRSFMDDQQAALNFAYAAVGKVTVVAKQILAAYYGQGPRRSYFVGCSTGGREAMLMAQRYPTYFDGVVSGDPAMRTGHSNLALAWAAVAFNQAAPKDAAGKPLASRLFSPADRQLLVRGLLDQCDARDGLKDGMIFDAAACRFDPAVIACKGAKTDACLSKGQVGALRRAFAGPVGSKGARLYSPFPYDTGVIAEGGGIPGFLPSAAPSPLGPPNQAMSIDPDAMAAQVAADPQQTLTDTAGWTNLGTFLGRGGKLVFFHGLSDPWFSPLDTLDYYQRMAAANGGEAKVRDAARIFLVPGMGHCQGGPATLDRFDLLAAVSDWVETGKAPDAVTATGKAFPGRSRPLCAWPEQARYTGGDPQSAASFQCRR